MRMVDYYRTDMVHKEEPVLVDAYYSSAFLLEAYEIVIGGYEVQARIKIKRLPHGTQNSNDLYNLDYIVRYGEPVYAISSNGLEDDGYENSMVYLFREEITVEQYLNFHDSDTEQYEYKSHCISYQWVRDFLEDDEDEIDLHYGELL